ncbi:Two-component system protein B [Pseudocercospora fuligena]|uniref:histidine kinase n=1 Tax=Pseudocercospora fuligena TaxID=685502 RepID=A0A8H6RRQ3_9PEZI|nr:Two-component system protein B [Pseudocercospora fuligena]
MEKPAEDPFTYFLPELLQSPRIKDIIEELERQLAKDEETGRKAVVMSYNNVVYHVIHLVCKSNGINSAIFISSNPKRPNERASKIEEFNKDQYSDPHVLVCSVGIAKRGYNMVEANLLIMVDLDWNLAASEQAKCRENRTRNEADKRVSVGYSVPPTELVDWVVVVEQARSEVWEPIDTLRTIILACLFGVAGFWLILSFPIAYWAVLPITRLRAATEQTVNPPRGDNKSQGSSDDTTMLNSCEKSTSSARSVRKTPIGLVERIARWRGQRRGGLHIEEREGDSFRIPGKVPDKKQWVRDEMTDLIHTFNEMSDELYVQYTRLEERVRQRTIELEHSKKAAEAANESKTIFVANVSHELKTPLNGILGMCAVCMEEDDPSRLKQSLGIIYKSGDLLLRTLSDLLTFSTNQVGHQVLKLDEKEFFLRDLESQVFAIFLEQAKDRVITLDVAFEEPPAVTVDLKDKTLRNTPFWGDIHRLLQVVINLTSNALKFTPTMGCVTVTIRALTELPPRRTSRASRLDRTGSKQDRRHTQLMENGSAAGTANFINPRERSHVQDRLAERARSPPPGEEMFIEFEVSDTGPGIPEEMQQQIFEPFVQGDAGLSRKHSGTGLGLSICTQLVHLMRGSIKLKSTVGEGSTFTVKLPLRRLTQDSTRTSRDGNVTASARSSIAIIREEPEKLVKVASKNASKASGADQMQQEIASATESKPLPSVVSVPAGNASAQAAAIKKAAKDTKTAKEAQHDFSAIRVLVAEDNKVNQEVIRRMLKLEKILDVTIAENGEQALDLVKSTSSSEASWESEASTPPFDLIFMDIQMPTMDGLTSTKLIRQHGFTKPIVALTAFAEQSNVNDCLESGMDYFLAKPIKRPQLKKVLTEYCSPTPEPLGKTKSAPAASALSSATDQPHGTIGEQDDPARPVDAA